MTYAQGIAQLFQYVDFHLKTKIVSPLYLKNHYLVIAQRIMISHAMYLHLHQLTRICSSNNATIALNFCCCVYTITAVVVQALFSPFQTSASKENQNRQKRKTYGNIVAISTTNTLSKFSSLKSGPNCQIVIVAIQEERLFS